MGDVLDTISSLGLLVTSFAIMDTKKHLFFWVGFTACIIFTVIFYFYFARTIIVKAENRNSLPKGTFNEILKKLKLGFLI